MKKKEEEEEKEKEIREKEITKMEGMRNKIEKEYN